MVGHSIEAEATAGRALPGDAPVEASRVVAFLDGSPFAERALPVAGWIAGELRVGLELIEVVSARGDGEGAVRYLCGTATLGSEHLAGCHEMEAGSCRPDREERAR
jgi:hypothetical protein